MNMLTMNRVLKISTIAALALTTITASAQISGNSSSSGAVNALVLIVSPQNPKPNSYASIEVKTVLTDLTQANIGWLENGKLSESGVGKTRHTLLVGKTGSSVTVTSVVQAENSLVYEQSVVIRPESVDLIWESPSSVPPFYRGKALYTESSGIKIIAMPEIIGADGKKIATTNLFYKWRKDTTILGSLSGYGHSSLLIQESVLRTPFLIGVTATSKDGLYTAEGSISLDTVEPQVFVYEHSPLYGILFNHAIQNSFSLTARELVLEAFPFFFSASTREKLNYVWSVNGTQTEGSPGTSLTLRSPEGEKGTASVYLSVTGNENFGEGATAGIKLDFGSNN